MIEKKLQLNNIVKKYGGVLALDNVSVEFEAGYVYGLVGENGAGKSTLMKVLNGAVRKDSGNILADGKEVEISSPNDAQRLGIGMVYQELHLMPDLTVTENLFIAQLSKKKSGLINWGQLKRETKTLFKEKLGVDIDPNQLVGELKVANQQVIAIMRALAMNCRVIIFDEPTSALSVSECRGLLRIIDKLKEQNYIIIYISHKLDEVIKISDRIIALRNGRKIKEINNREPGEQLTDKSLSELIAGRVLEEKFPKKRFTVGEELLRVENLRLKGKLENISFSLKKGEILGITGLLGAGKTEIAGALFGVYGNQKEIISGDIYLNNQKLNIKSPGNAIAQGIALLPESRNTEGLLLGLSIGWNISLANLANISKAGFIDKQAENREINAMIDSMKIKCASVQNPVSSLSGGNQQKVALGRWVSTEGVKIVIFDEPTRGIDVGAKVEIYNLMNELVEKGVGVIAVSSEIDEVNGMADRILLLSEGKIINEMKHGEYSDQEIYDMLMKEAGGLYNE